MHRVRYFSFVWYIRLLQSCVNGDGGRDTEAYSFYQVRQRHRTFGEIYRNYRILLQYRWPTQRYHIHRDAENLCNYCYLYERSSARENHLSVRVDKLLKIWQGWLLEKNCDNYYECSDFGRVDGGRFLTQIAPLLKVQVIDIGDKLPRWGKVR